VKNSLSLSFDPKNINNKMIDDDTKSLLPPPPTKTTRDKKVKEIKKQK